MSPGLLPSTPTPADSKSSRTNASAFPFPNQLSIVETSPFHQPPSIGSAAPEPLQVAEVRGEGLSQGDVTSVVDAVLHRDLADHPGERGVVEVAHLGEEVVLHLEVEPAQEPRDGAARGREVDGRVDLVSRPVVV